MNNSYIIINCLTYNDNITFYMRNNDPKYIKIYLKPY